MHDLAIQVLHVFMGLTGLQSDPSHVDYAEMKGTEAARDRLVLFTATMVSFLGLDGLVKVGGHRQELSHVTIDTYSPLASEQFLQSIAAFVGGRYST